jgi:hypothetical protein|nr:hypothetical protein [Kofleriaceae bacterium]
MRRALVLALVAASATAAVHVASASPPWTVTAEAGAEYDTNVERVDNGTLDDQNRPVDPVTAAVSRFGGRVIYRHRLLGGTFYANASALARVVSLSEAQPVGSFADPQDASVTTLTLDARYLHNLPDRPISLGAAVTAADALAICTDGCVGDRTYSNVGADAIVALHSGDDRHLTLAVGGRDFEYKPLPEFSWSGPVANARLDLVLSQTEDHTRSIELAVTSGFEARSYNDDALVIAPCMTGSPQGEVCTAPTTFTRRDRFEHIGADVTFVGRRIVTVGYQLGFIDSNSFGQSLIRHRITASATSELPWQLYGTLLATLQLDQYPDGLVLLNAETDQVRNLEDESRSSLQLRLARHVSDAWSIEMRAAVWRDLGDTQGDEFHRTLLSLGVVYASP